MKGTPHLSGFTEQRINWRKIDDTTRALLDEVGGQRSAETSEPEIDPQLIRDAFASVKLEFERVLGPLRRRMYLVSGIILLSIAVAIAGAALAMVSPWRGSALCIAGIGSLLGFLSRGWQLSKDQAMLELIPSRYELALQLCLSREQYRDILSRFMEETTAVRST